VKTVTVVKESCFVQKRRMVPICRQLILRKTIIIAATRAKMHQIRFRLGLRPRPRSGCLQRSPTNPPAGYKGEGATSKGGADEGEKGRGKGRKGKGPTSKGWGKERTGGEGGGEREEGCPPPLADSSGSVPGPRPRMCLLRVWMMTHNIETPKKTQKGGVLRHFSANWQNYKIAKSPAKKIGSTPNFDRVIELHS